MLPFNDSITQKKADCVLTVSKAGFKSFHIDFHSIMECTETISKQYEINLLKIYALENDWQ